MKIEIKKLILCAAVSLILLPAEEVLGSEQMASVKIPVVQQFETRNKLPDKMNQTFRYELIREEQDAPMPGESDGDRYVFDMKGSEKKRGRTDHIYAYWNMALYAETVCSEGRKGL